MVPPVADWADVVDLNYDNADMREEMIQSLEFWLRETDIDGYRCDVAEMVPMDFWIDARARIDSVKPNFFLAEGEAAELHEAFDMTYAWSFHHLMNKVARGEKGASDIAAYWAEHSTKYNTEDYRMQFITNHDENSWNGTARERMGNYRKAFAVMSFTVPGMPLIYSGQESDINKRLAFFEKDVIDWSNDSLVDFYKKLVSIKSNHPELSNGSECAPIEFLDAGNNQVIAYSRKSEQEQLIVILNFSDKPVGFKLEGDIFEGEQTFLLDGSTHDNEVNFVYDLAPGGYQVLHRSIEGK
jgi:glycosidase